MGAAGRSRGASKDALDPPPALPSPVPEALPAPGPVSDPWPDLGFIPWPAPWPPPFPLAGFSPPSRRPPRPRRRRLRPPRSPRSLPLLRTRGRVGALGLRVRSGRAALGGRGVGATRRGIAAALAARTSVTPPIARSISSRVA